MNRKQLEKEWERGRRVDAAFPKKLDAAAIRKLKADYDNPPDEEAARDAECAWRKFKAIVQCAAGNYANYVQTPRLIAETRRKYGDRTAAPEDYDCRCQMRDKDACLQCDGVIPNCKFAPFRGPPPPYGNFHGKLWHELHRGFQYQTLSSISWDRPEAVAALLAEIDRELKKACARRKRTIGKEFTLHKDPWSA